MKNRLSKLCRSIWITCCTENILQGLNSSRSCHNIANGNVSLVFLSSLERCCRQLVGMMLLFLILLLNCLPMTKELDAGFSLAVLRLRTMIFHGCHSSPTPATPIEMMFSLYENTIFKWNGKIEGYLYL
jgi:hypothetical protein